MKNEMMMSVPVRAMNSVVDTFKKVGEFAIPMYKFSFEKKRMVKANSLRMDTLLQFAMLALFLWVIVKNSPVANEAFNSIMTTAKGQITNLFNSMGSF
ncbi:hypothetical protein [Paenibacillus sp. 1A_MP2]|uniref:hypothetical protein n=1 Tax=Paenibacillus sp. 1A_MP2 TaxID=3457495 RepID=UPI003FCE4AA3